MIQNIWWPQKYYFFSKFSSLFKKNETKSIKIMLFFAFLSKNGEKAD